MNTTQRIGKQDMGLKRYRQVLFDNKVQQRLGQYLVKKDLLHSNGDNSLEGLDIDWHLAEYDYSPMVPVSNDEPTYAYA
tara:strand:+ start:570 stop:806 length:237 start_codon:yes stop_codon:yes gene_type:complete